MRNLLSILIIVIGSVSLAEGSAPFALTEVGLTSAQIPLVKQAIKSNCIILETDHKIGTFHGDDLVSPEVVAFKNIIDQLVPGLPRGQVMLIATIAFAPATCLDLGIVGHTEERRDGPTVNKIDGQN